MEYVCTICGKTFETVGKAKYCDSCRAKAYREKNTKKQQERRAKMYAAEKAENKKKSKQRSQDRERDKTALLNERRSKLIRDAEAGDLIAQLKLVGEIPDHLYRQEYWSAFREYAADMDGDKFESVVNGISVHDPDFETRVIDSLKHGKIVASIEKRGSSVRKMESEI